MGSMTSDEKEQGNAIQSSRAGQADFGCTPWTPSGGRHWQIVSSLSLSHLACPRMNGQENKFCQNQRTSLFFGTFFFLLRQSLIFLLFGLLCHFHFLFFLFTWLFHLWKGGCLPRKNRVLDPESKREGPNEKAVRFREGNQEGRHCRKRKWNLQSQQAWKE